MIEKIKMSILQYKDKKELFKLEFEKLSFFEKVVIKFFNFIFMFLIIIILFLFGIVDYLKDLSLFLV